MVTIVTSLRDTVDLPEHGNKQIDQKNVHEEHMKGQQHLSGNRR